MLLEDESTCNNGFSLPGYATGLLFMAAANKVERLHIRAAGNNDAFSIHKAGIVSA